MIDIHNKLMQFIDNGQFFLENVRDLILIKDLQSTCYGFSDSLCHLLKIKRQSLLGLSDYDLPWEKFADLYHQCDQEVLKGKKNTSLQPLQINKNTVLIAKIIKSPILDDEKKVIGIFAQAELLESNPILSSIMLTDKKNTAISEKKPKNYQISHYHAELKLSSREAECLFLIIRAKSAKEIGEILDISYRTVESYIEGIKNKMHVSTRSEIIAKAIEMNMLEIIPKSFFLETLLLKSKKISSVFEH